MCASLAGIRAERRGRFPVDSWLRVMQHLRPRRFDLEAVGKVNLTKQCGDSLHQGRRKNILIVRGQRGDESNVQGSSVNGLKGTVDLSDFSKECSRVRRVALRAIPSMRIESARFSAEPREARDATRDSLLLWRRSAPRQLNEKLTLERPATRREIAVVKHSAGRHSAATSRPRNGFDPLAAIRSQTGRPALPCPRVAAILRGPNGDHARTGDRSSAPARGVRCARR